MSQFFALLFAAVVIEGLISYIKLFVVNGKFQWQNIVAIALGILISFTYQIDLFAIVGLKSEIKYVGIILTGILVSRGSNYIFDLIKWISEFKKNTTES